jgi:integrase/recombinase XerD
MEKVLSVYRRHLKTCPHTADRFYRRCSCPLWVIGTDPQGNYHRRTLKTSNWTTAEEQKRKIEVGEEDRPKIEISAALESWKNALLGAKRKTRTVKQVHGAMANSLSGWCKDNGYVRLDRITLDVLDNFVSTWKYASTTHRSRIDLMRGFFKFCVARKWITENPASGLIKPKESQEPTLPFTAEEESRIFGAAERFHKRANLGGLWTVNHQTAHALLLVMRWTGLRASDAVLFEPRAIESVLVDGCAVSVYSTYQTKTGEYVMCPLSPDVAAAIQAAPRLSKTAAFIPSEDSGLNRDARSVSNGFYSTYLCPLSALAGVTGVRAHRFRDTFAVRLLEAGKPLEVVAKLLGHKSIKTTEKHYAPWVKSRQDALTREVMRTWVSGGNQHPTVDTLKD